MPLADNRWFLTDTFLSKYIPLNYMISVVLVEPETAGNIGAVARLMKNFDFRDLVLIHPQCDHLSAEALDRATHAKDILRRAQVEKDISCLEAFDYVIATTA